MSKETMLRQMKKEDLITHALSLTATVNFLRTELTNANATVDKLCDALESVQQSHRALAK